MASKELTAAEYITYMSEGNAPDGNPSVYNLVNLLVAESSAHTPDDWNSLINRAGSAIRTFESRYGINNTDRLLRAQWSLSGLKQAAENNLEVIQLDNVIDNADLDTVESLEGKTTLTVADVLKVREIVYDSNGLNERCGIDNLEEQTQDLFEAFCGLTVGQINKLESLSDGVRQVLAQGAEFWPELLDVEDLTSILNTELCLQDQTSAKNIFERLLSKLTIGLHDMMGGGMREKADILNSLAVIQRIQIESSYNSAF